MKSEFSISSNVSRNSRVIIFRIDCSDYLIPLTNYHNCILIFGLSACNNG